MNDIGLCDNFFDLGGDSLRAASLIIDVEKHFGKKIRLNDFFVAPTLAGLAALLRESGYSSKWTSLIPIQSHGSKPPFFWVHGDASNFLLPAYLGQDQVFYAFIHQAQDGTAARYTSVEQIAAHYLEELYSVQPEGPYFLGGYSFGGLVAFEMAQQLRSRGEAVPLLALLDATSPRTDSPDSYGKLQIPGPSRSAYDGRLDSPARVTSFTRPELVAHVILKIMRLLKQVWRFPRLKRASRRAIYKFCIKLGRQMPQSVRGLHLMDVYNEAVRNYSPRVYPARVIFFKTSKNLRDRASSWSHLVTGGLEVHSVPGDHTSIVKEPQLKVWAEKLKNSLNEAQTDSSLLR